MAHIIAMAVSKRGLSFTSTFILSVERAYKQNIAPTRTHKNIKILKPYIKFEHIDNPNCGTTIIEGRMKVAEMGQIL